MKHEFCLITHLEALKDLMEYHILTAAKYKEEIEKIELIYLK